jgi:hypothetical protein
MHEGILLGHWNGQIKPFSIQSWEINKTQIGVTGVCRVKS